MKLFVVVIAAVLLNVLTGATGCTRTIHHVRPHVITPSPHPPETASRRGFHQWNCSDAIQSFKDAGLEVGDRENGIIAGVPGAEGSEVFFIPSYGEDVGVVVASFGNKEKLGTALDYYRHINKGRKPPAWRIFSKDNILLLISGRIPRETAADYGRVLLELKR